MNAAMWKPLALTIAVDHLDRASHHWLPKSQSRLWGEFTLFVKQVNLSFTID